MKSRRDLIIVALATFCLTSTLFMAATSMSADSPNWNPWADINSDGTVDIFDAILLAVAFNTDGQAINKTQLLDTQSKMNTAPFQAGQLVNLPFFATKSDYSVNVGTILWSLSLNQSAPGNQQQIFALADSTVTVSGTFQIWQEQGGTGAIMQAFFIYSWTPNWPPPNSTYYYPLYNDAPNNYPGSGVQSFGFDITVPHTSGVYYLYFCMNAQYSMEDAVSMYAQALYVPYAVICVGA